MLYFYSINLRFRDIVTLVRSYCQKAQQLNVTNNLGLQSNAKYFHTTHKI